VRSTLVLYEARRTTSVGFSRRIVDGISVHTNGFLSWDNNREFLAAMGNVLALSQHFFPSYQYKYCKAKIFKRLWKMFLLYASYFPCLGKYDKIVRASYGSKASSSIAIIAGIQKI